MSRLSSPLGLLATTLVVLGSAGCGAPGRSGSGFSSDGGGGDDGSNMMVGADGGDGGHTDGSIMSFGDSGPPNTTLGCSADLHNVINQNGTVVQMCPANEGCAAGKCVPACTAAAANHGNIGCDFLVATPSFYADYAYNGGSYYGPCFAVFLTNNWGTPMAITVTRAGAMYDATKFGLIPQPGMPATSWLPVPATGVPPGQVAILFLEQAVGATFTCPIAPALSQGTAVKGTGTGIAWHIVTGAPVSAYDILPYGGAASYLPGAELLFPTSAWGTNYVAVVPKFGSGGLDSGPQWGQVLAVQDNTQVKVVPTTSLPGGTNVPAAPANTVTTYTLQAGEFVQWQNPFASTSGTTPMEMSGTVLQSNNPVAFMSGNSYLCLSSATSGGGGCDSAHQQIPPVSALGSEYAPAPYTTRRADMQEESLPYRMVGMVSGTTLTYDPPMAGAPTTLALGQYVDFEATGAFDVKSQDAMHPFYVGQMMPGCEVTSGSQAPGGCIGDEDYVNVMAPAQFLSSYVFFTDPTYATTTFTFVRVKGAQGFSDVKVDCMNSPITGWKPLGSSGKFEWARADLVRGTGNGGMCTNGPHSATSGAPFGLTVWGFDQFASYSYPAGTNIAAINTVVVPPMSQ